jgi:hypothetical protein
MKLPTIQGIIKRRILVNFRADPYVVQKQLPPRFRPKLQNGHAVVGICLIRLEHLRPRLVPSFAGLNSENAAHRIAVLWDDENGHEHEGVFIPRRDTNSPVNLLLGGRVFPGEHHRATFSVRETPSRISFAMRSTDHEVAVSLEASMSPALPTDSVFNSLSDASAFFEHGSLGYSLTRTTGRLDGLKLKTRNWKVAPLTVSMVRSSYFSDKSHFPVGSVEFDHALIMRDISHEWYTADNLYV